MPIYEYRCENGHLFEVFQSMSDDAVTECEVCGAPVERSSTRWPSTSRDRASTRPLQEQGRGQILQRRRLGFKGQLGLEVGLRVGLKLELEERVEGRE